MYRLRQLALQKLRPAGSFLRQRLQCDRPCLCARLGLGTDDTPFNFIARGVGFSHMAVRYV